MVNNVSLVEGGGFFGRRVYLTRSEGWYIHFFRRVVFPTFVGGYVIIVIVLEGVKQSVI